MSEADKVRWAFEKFMRHNGMSVDRSSSKPDSSYRYQRVQDAWVSFQVGATRAWDTPA